MHESNGARGVRSFDRLQEGVAPGPAKMLTTRAAHPRANPLRLDPAASPAPDPVAAGDCDSTSAPDPGTSGASTGVAGTSPVRFEVPVATSFRRVGLRGVVLLLLASLSLLGQGEQCRVDPRFVSPSSTLVTFWEAIRAGDAEGVWECFVEGRHDLPVPGMLWFLPPTERISLGEFRSLPIAAGRVLVTYEVRFLPEGYDEEGSFRTGDELVRMRGQWRIARPIGEASTPELKLPPRTFDI